MRYALVFWGTTLSLWLWLSLLDDPKINRFSYRLGNLDGSRPELAAAATENARRIRARRQARQRRKKLLTWLARSLQVLLWSAALILLLGWSNRFKELAILLAACGTAILVLRHHQTQMVAWQLAPALDRLAGCLQQTNSFYGALEHVAKTAPWPISREFRKILRSLSRGGTEEVALAALAKRHPHPEVEMVAAALGRTQQRGQRLGESLRAIQVMLEAQRMLAAAQVRRSRPSRILAWVLFAVLVALARKGA